MTGQREQAIRERAYAIWEEEGHPDCRDVMHWLQAEAELSAAQPKQTFRGRYSSQDSRARIALRRTPDFQHTGLKSPITEVAVLLAAQKDMNRHSPNPGVFAAKDRVSDRLGQGLIVHAARIEAAKR